MEDSSHAYPLVLLILDGWGIAAPGAGNAIAQAATPQMDSLMQDYPTIPLHAAGEMVGLPWEEKGNSEVGHLNIGSGKIVYQSLPRINQAIQNGAFQQNQILLQAIQTVKSNGGRLHLIGLVSDGGIHSSEEHLFALLDMCREHDMKENVFVHAMLDGRDTNRNAALQGIAKLETAMQEKEVGRIASLAGRFWAMDRDNRWDRTEAAYNAMRSGKAEKKYDSPLKAIEQSYINRVFDEEFEPTVITDADGNPLATIEEDDAVIFFNFRSDRARQLTKAFVLDEFAKFERGPKVPNLFFVTMTEYEEGLPVEVAFQQEDVSASVAQVISDAGMKQLHVAETEKYAHVTFFFNGGREEPLPHEDRILVPSPRVKSYDEQPEMSATDIGDRIIEALSEEDYQFIVANFANADMVGHTGNLEATKKSVEVVDTQMGRIVEAVLNKGGQVIITADHGNAEKMIDPHSGEMMKEHTTNPVPCIMISAALKERRHLFPPVENGDLSRLQPFGVLSDVGPTVLSLLGIERPEGMSGKPLVEL